LLELINSLANFESSGRRLIIWLLLDSQRVLLFLVLTIIVYSFTQICKDHYWGTHHMLALQLLG